MTKNNCGMHRAPFVGVDERFQSPLDLAVGVARPQDMRGHEVMR